MKKISVYLFVFVVCCFLFSCKVNEKEKFLLENGYTEVEMKNEFPMYEDVPVFIDAVKEVAKLKEDPNNPYYLMVRAISEINTDCSKAKKDIEKAYRLTGLEEDYLYMLYIYTVCHDKSEDKTLEKMAIELLNILKNMSGTNSNKAGLSYAASLYLFKIEKYTLAKRFIDLALSLQSDDYIILTKKRYYKDASLRKKYKDLEINIDKNLK